MLHSLWFVGALDRYAIVQRRYNPRDAMTDHSGQGLAATWL